MWVAVALGIYIQHYPVSDSDSGFFNTFVFWKQEIFYGTMIVWKVIHLGYNLQKILDDENKIERGNTGRIVIQGMSWGPEVHEGCWEPKLKFGEVLAPIARVHDLVKRIWLRACEDS